MKIRHLVLFCIIFLIPVLSAPLEKTKRNSGTSESTFETFKNIDVSNPKNYSVTLNSLTIEENKDVDISLPIKINGGSKRIKINLENRGKARNGEFRKLEEKKEQNLPEIIKKNEYGSGELIKEEKGRLEKTRKEEKKRERSGNFMKKVNNNKDLSPKTKSLSPSRRSFTNSKIENSEEINKKRINNEKGPFKDQRKLCECKKKNKRRKVRNQNDEVLESSEIDPSLDYKIESLIPMATEATNLAEITTIKPIALPYQSRRVNFENLPRYLDEKKKKKKRKKCKKKKKIVPKNKENLHYSTGIDIPPEDSYLQSARINRNENYSSIQKF